MVSFMVRQDNHRYDERNTLAFFNVEVPDDNVESNKIYLKILTTLTKERALFPLPFYQALVPAGFPSPADDYIEAALDLNEHLIKNPAATFFVRVKGDSMIHASIYDNDILIVDRSLTSRNGNIMIAPLNGDFTVRYLQKREDHVFLCLYELNILIGSK